MCLEIINLILKVMFSKKYHLNFKIIYFIFKTFTFYMNTQDVSLMAVTGCITEYFEVDFFLKIGRFLFQGDTFL